MAETLTIEIREGSGGKGTAPSPPAAPPAQLPPVPRAGQPGEGRGGRPAPRPAPGAGEEDDRQRGPSAPAAGGMFGQAANLLNALGMNFLAALSRVAGQVQGAFAPAGPSAMTPAAPPAPRPTLPVPAAPTMTPLQARAPSAPPARPPAGTPAATPAPAVAGGGMGALAGAGVAGAIVAAAMQVKRMAEEGMRAGVESMGRFAQGVARLDAGAVADGFQGLVKHVPWVGPALAEVTKQARGFADALSDTARRLSNYNSALAAAQAHADVRQILGDLRRSQMLGTDLSRFVDARSRLSDASQDAMASLLKPLIPLATQVLEHLTTLVQGVSNVESLLPSLITGAIRSSLGVVMPGLGDALNPLLAVLEQHLGAIARVMGRAEDHAPARDFTEELLGAGRWAGINGIRPVGAAPRGDVGARFPFLGG